MGSILCEHCTALCCRYIALPIETPTTARDFDDLRWYLMHEDMMIFVEDGDWYLQINRRCRYLRPDNRCGIYGTRPEICREDKTDECDYHGGDYDYDHLFRSPEAIEAFGKAYLLNRRRRKEEAPRKGTDRRRTRLRHVG